VLKAVDREIGDVMGSVNRDTDNPLPGQSCLRRYRSWSLDNQRPMMALQ